MKTKRLYFILDLVDDFELIAEYERLHLPENAWREVVDSIVASNILEMEIYRSETRLVMSMEVLDSFDSTEYSRADIDDPNVQKWETLMDRFQQRLPWASEGQKWVPLKRIYRLSEARIHTGTR